MFVQTAERITDPVAFMLADPSLTDQLHAHQLMLVSGADYDVVYRNTNPLNWLVEQDSSFGEHVNGFRVFQCNISPQHRLFAHFYHDVTEHPAIIDIHTRFTFFFYFCFAECIVS